MPRSRRVPALSAGRFSTNVLPLRGRDSLRRRTMIPSPMMKTPTKNKSTVSQLFGNPKNGSTVTNPPARMISASTVMSGSIHESIPPSYAAAPAPATHAKKPRRDIAFWLPFVITPSSTLLAQSFRTREGRPARRSHNSRDSAYFRISPLVSRLFGAVASRQRHPPRAVCQLGLRDFRSLYIGDPTRSVVAPAYCALSPSDVWVSHPS